VPHHTANSWYSYWARDQLADRLLATVKGKTDEIYGNNAKDVGGVYDDEDSQDSEEETGSSDEEDVDDAAMGGAGSAFRRADIKVMAKHIAQYNSTQWAEMSNKQRWFPFHEEVNLIYAAPNLTIFNSIFSILSVLTSVILRNTVIWSPVCTLEQQPSVRRLKSSPQNF
jgi:hypothetical protein